MNRTPSTRCSFRRKSGVSCSDSAGFVFVPSSVVATSPSVMRWWLASSYVMLCVIVEGSTLGAFSSWMHVLGSTRLTQVSFVSSLLLVAKSIWVAITELFGSV